MEVGREGEDRYRVWCGEEEERERWRQNRRGKEDDEGGGKWEGRKRQKVKGRRWEENWVCVCGEGKGRRGGMERVDTRVQHGYNSSTLHKQYK